MSAPCLYRKCCRPFIFLFKLKRELEKVVLFHRFCISHSRDSERRAEVVLPLLMPPFSHQILGCLTSKDGPRTFVYKPSSYRSWVSLPASWRRGEEGGDVLLGSGDSHSSCCLFPPNLSLGLCYLPLRPEFCMTFYSITSLSFIVAVIFS